MSDSDDDMPPVLVGNKVPLTLLTGYLGAGKSTLIQWILQEEHGMRIAVIMNEFSDTADIEARAISVQAPSGETTTPLLTLPNGCLCCSSRDTGFAAIQELVAQRGAFDYILLETTGLADPGPIAETFWQNEEWDADVRLDGVVCVVDAMWGVKQSQEPAQVEGEASEWAKQIACADILLLNKVADVPSSQVAETERLIRAINPAFPIHHTTRSRVPLTSLLNQQAYSPNPHEQIVIPKFQSPSTAFISSSSTSSSTAADPPHHPHAHGPATPNSSTAAIASELIPLPPLQSAQKTALEAWIRTLLWDPDALLPSSPSVPASPSREESAAEVLRLKGIVWLTPEDEEKGDAEEREEEAGAGEGRVARRRKGWVIQGVRGVYEMEEVFSSSSEEEEEGEGGKIVVIGRYVGRLGDSLRRALGLH